MTSSIFKRGLTLLSISTALCLVGTCLPSQSLLARGERGGERGGEHENMGGQRHEQMNRGNMNHENMNHESMNQHPYNNQHNYSNSSQHNAQMEHNNSYGGNTYNNASAHNNYNNEGMNRNAGYGGYNGTVGAEGNRTVIYGGGGALENAWQNNNGGNPVYVPYNPNPTFPSNGYGMPTSGQQY